MTNDQFISHAQNGEDVVLWRALGSVEQGTYVDVGANHPLIDSVSRSFYDHGWRGLLVEPNIDFADLLRAERDGDIVAEVVASNVTGTVTLHSVPGTGLSTIVDSVSAGHSQAGTEVVDIEVASVGLSDLLTDNGFDERPIHFLSIDTEGAEGQVLRSIDFTRHRPWVMVIEATAPTTTTQVHSEWEHVVLDAGYEFCLFDGLSRFYVASERAAQFGALLSYPACVFDDFITLEDRKRQVEFDDLRAAFTSSQELLDTRGVELQALDAQLQQMRDDRDDARAEADECRADAAGLRRTVSWRVTAPLRAARRVTQKRT